jgi:hypothetical protein
MAVVTTMSNGGDSNLTCRASPFLLYARSARHTEDICLPDPRLCRRGGAGWREWGNVTRRSSDMLVLAAAAR